jgi:hypothetical protein
MTWTNADAWADSLALGGATEWRLPSILDTGSSGCNGAFAGTDCGFNVQTKSGTLSVYEDGQSVYSEMAHMFYVTLANDGWYGAGGSPTGCPGWPTYCLTNDGDFLNLQPDYYWSGTAYAPNPGDYAWYFYFYGGSQDYTGHDFEWYAWAVHSGDVGAAAPVPIPAAAWLLGSGLVGLLGIGRQRRADQRAMATRRRRYSAAKPPSPDSSSQPAAGSGTGVVPV